MLISAICAAANNAVIILGGLAGGHYLIMTAVAFLIVTPLGYLFHCRFTFAEKRSLRGLFRFWSGSALAFPVSLLTMALLCSGLKLPVTVATPVATVVLFLWNYLSAQWAITGHAWPFGASRTCE